MREIRFRLRLDNEIVGYEKWYSGERAEVEPDTPGVTLYLKGEPIHIAGWKMQPWMIPFLEPPKPRSPWQRFLRRIGL